MNKTIKKQVLFILIFAVLGFIALQIPVAKLAGAKASFTLFDVLAPTAGAFLGAIPGLLAVALMQIFNFTIHGLPTFSSATAVRFITPLAATMYFAKNTKLNIVILLLAILSFVLNPVGRSVWYFSLYWLIPVFCALVHERSLLARSFGATFTAHAVGGAFWIWLVPLPKAVWIGLIPVVAIERTVFGMGIAASYVALANVLAYLETKRVPSLGTLLLDRRYIWKRA